MRELLSTICRQHATSWAWRARSASAVPWSHLRPSATMAGRATSCLQKETPTSHLHWPNHKHKVCKINIPKMGTWKQDWKEDLTSVGLPHWGYPTPSAWTWTVDQTSIEPMHTYNLNLLASRLDSSNVRMSPSGTGPFTLHMVEWLLSSKNLT